MLADFWDGHIDGEDVAFFEDDELTVSCIITVSIYMQHAENGMQGI